MAIDLFNEFATNAEAEEKGVWQDFAPGVKFLIARSTNKHYSRALTKAFEKNRTVLSRTTDAAEAMSEDIMIGVIARTILLDWEGVVYQGKAMDYSFENARTLLAHKDFRRWVMSKAEDLDSFKAVQEAEDEEK